MEGLAILANRSRVQPAARDNTDQAAEIPVGLCQTLKRGHPALANHARSNRRIPHTPATQLGGRSVTRLARSLAIQVIHCQPMVFHVLPPVVPFLL